MMLLKLNIVVRKLRGIDWKLFLFLVLVMNVKLVVKIIAIIAIVVLERKSFTLKSFIRKPYILFYMGMIAIALINLLLQYRDLHLPYLLVTGMGILLWMMPAIAGYHSYNIVQKGDLDKIHRTVSFFFLVHVAIIFASLLMIILEIRTIDPYTFKGLNQKYYISTGDYIRGITFDDAVTTAMIAAFGLLYFLYRRRFFYSLLCMAGVLVIFSNLTNIFLLLIFVFLFIFKSDRVQKSMVIVYGCMLVIFITTVSPQNNEYVVSFIYKMIGKAYYLPPVKTIAREELKQMPDSLLSYDQKREKTGLVYLDSISHVLRANNRLLPEKALFQADTLSETGKKIFYEYRPTAQVKQKENRFSSFITFRYTSAEKDSLNKRYNWDKPGKITAALQLIDLYNNHPSTKWLGAGAGNFSSRIAFKSAAIGIGGAYPEKYAYVHPYFQNAHLYVYLFYHAQWQINHTAANTPDSTYFQIAGEYGIAGICLFVFLYAGYFLWKTRRSSYALPLLFLLLATFSVEYWFERLSIIVLFEFLVFLDVRTMLQEGPPNE
jgi:hypothetical protein